MRPLHTITVTWSLCDLSGVETFSRSEQVDKFCKELYGKKLAYAGLKLSNLTSFENKVYAYMAKAKRVRNRDMESFEAKYSDTRKRMEILKNAHLKISINHLGN